MALFRLTVSIRYIPVDLSCKFFQTDMILPGLILIAFCKGNVCVDDLFKLKSIFSVTLNIRVFLIFL